MISSSMDPSDFDYVPKRRRTEIDAPFESNTYSHINHSPPLQTVNPNLLHLIDHFQFANNAVPLQSETPWIPLKSMEDNEPSIFQLCPPPYGCEKGKLIFPLDFRLSDIFLSFLPPDFLRTMWNSYPTTHWIYGKGKRAGTLSKGIFNARLVYTCLAIYIRIIAMQNEVPQKIEPSDNYIPQSTSRTTSQPIPQSVSTEGELLRQPAIAIATEEARTDNRVPSLGDNLSSSKIYNCDFTGRPQRAAISEAVTHFRELIAQKLLQRQNITAAVSERLSLVTAMQEANNRLPGMQIVELIFSRFHFARSFWPDLCQKFRSALSSPGRCLVGDENLLHFTGSSGFIRIVPTKPDKIGLWFFELVCLLSDDNPYLLSAKLFDAKPNQGQIPVNIVVEEWIEIAKEYRVISSTIHPVVNDDDIASKPILVFDSYYMDEVGHELLLAEKIPFIATVQPKKFLSLAAELERFGMKVQKPGQSALLWNEMTNEILLHHFDLLPEIGQRYLLSNAFYPREIHPHSQQLQLHHSQHNPNNSALACELYQAFSSSNDLPNLSYREPSLQHIPQRMPSQYTVSSAPATEIDQSNYLPLSSSPSPLETFMSKNGAFNYDCIPQQVIFPVYRKFFETCSLFNQHIHSYKYCHKAGGFQKAGEEGLCHRFIMACVLHNTIAAYRNLQSQKHLNQHHTTSTEASPQMKDSFSALCIQLSDELLLYAMDGH